MARPVFSPQQLSCKYLDGLQAMAGSESRRSDGASLGASLPELPELLERLAGFLGGWYEQDDWPRLWRWRFTTPPAPAAPAAGGPSRHNGSRAVGGPPAGSAAAHLQRERKLLAGVAKAMANAAGASDADADALSIQLQIVVVGAGDLATTAGSARAELALRRGLTAIWPPWRDEPQDQLEVAPRGWRAGAVRGTGG